MSASPEDRPGGSVATVDATPDFKKDELEHMATAGEKSVNIGDFEEAEDYFYPLRDVEPYDGRRILTVRALVTGVFLGSIISCANVYLGMFSLHAKKTMWYLLPRRKPNPSVRRSQDWLRLRCHFVLLHLWLRHPQVYRAF